MATATYTKTGNAATSKATLNKDIFEVEVKGHQLLQQAYLTQAANSRTNNATTKLRGEVRGGGRKPWRQKGTGRARVGSIRSPLWRGGGVTFGPSGNENYSKKLNKKARQSALRQALTLKNQAGAIKVIDAFETKGKVSETVGLLSKIEATGKILLVVDEFTALVSRATRNVSQLKALSAQYLNVVDVMDADEIVFDKKSLEILNKWLGA